MVSALDSIWIERFRSSPGREHFVVFLGKALYSLAVPLSSQVFKWVPANVGGTNPAMGLHARSKNTSRRFMLHRNCVQARLIEILVLLTLTLLTLLRVLYRVFYFCLFYFRFPMNVPAL